MNNNTSVLLLLFCDEKLYLRAINAGFSLSNIAVCVETNDNSIKFHLSSLGVFLWRRRTCSQLALNALPSLWLANGVSGTYFETAPQCYWLWRFKRGVNHPNRSIHCRVISCATYLAWFASREERTALGLRGRAHILRGNYFSFFIAFLW